MDSFFLKQVFEETEIVKKPTFGIISGYHALPYILLGQDEGDSLKTLEIRGKISVSPRFVLSYRPMGQTYDEVFGKEQVNSSLVGRVFSFLYCRKKPLYLEEEGLQVTQIPLPLHECLSRALDELERKEIINTGVIITPSVKFYPVSIEKFIVSILDEELLG